MLDATIEAVKHITAIALDEIDTSEGWDRPPLLVAHTSDGENNIFLLAGADMFDILKALVAQKENLAWGVPGVTAENIALVYEGWALKASSGHDVNAIARQLQAEGKRFSDHPDAVETKGIMVIDHEGVLGWQLERGQDEFTPLGSAPQGRLRDHLVNLFESAQ